MQRHTGYQVSTLARKKFGSTSWNMGLFRIDDLKGIEWINAVGMAGSADERRLPLSMPSFLMRVIAAIPATSMGRRPVVETDNQRRVPPPGGPHMAKGGYVRSTDQV